MPITSDKTKLSNQKNVRKLSSGREVESLSKEVSVIKTKCPAKWVCFDLEDDNIWISDTGRHYRTPNRNEINEVLHAIHKNGFRLKLTKVK